MPRDDLTLLAAEKKALAGPFTGRAWQLWSVLGDDALASIKAQLANSEWFPLDPQRNASTQPLCGTASRVHGRRRGPDCARLLLQTLSIWECRKAFLQAIGVVALEQAEEAKIRDQLLLMRQRVPHPDSHAKKDALRARYRLLVDRLSTLTAKQPAIAPFPLLCRESKQLLWNDDPKAKSAWFISQSQMACQSLFPRLCFVEFDPATSIEWAQAVGARKFAPIIKIEGQTHPDQETVKPLLEERLPDLIALAQELRVGGVKRDLEEVLQRWQVTSFEYGQDILQRIALEEGEQAISVKRGDGTQDDVLYEKKRRTPDPDSLRYSSGNSPE
ncbi:MAG: hypothetical protein MZV64_71600 [Ignavibacteriales bacterium]|nr:hypothetical protein [Ignavibacteriales bacterium]